MSINELNSLKKTKICFELIEIYLLRQGKGNFCYENKTNRIDKKNK